MAAVIFWHFLGSAITLFLRFQSRPTIRRIARCCAFFNRLCSCCCRNSVGTSVERLGGVPVLKWYWFHLAMQVGFIAREIFIVSLYDGWCVELIVAQTSVWLTLFLVVREVWLFSKLRHGSEKEKVAVDGLLDMLLLPLNIGFFCALCVRALKLQPHSRLANMVSVVIDSTDVYEAFALWSVLELFVTVVAAEGNKSTAHTDATTSFQSFRAVSLQGVKAWCYIQFAAVAFKLVLQGIVATYIPTFCFWFTKTCDTCEQWYEKKAELAVQAVEFLLCAFAIMFVFYFEAGYRSYLHEIEPVWKFLGVKGIVSVTFFQWTTINIVATSLSWEARTTYLLHCILYAFWMPLLTIMHAVRAYPFYAFSLTGDREMAPWLVSWITTLREQDPRQLGADDEADQSTEGRLHQSVLELAERVVRPGTSASCWQLYILGAALSCFASVWIVLQLLPIGGIMGVDKPFHNITCTGEGDLTRYVHDQSGSHVALRNGTALNYRVPGIGGAWLPLCSSVPVVCQPGYFSVSAATSVRCTPRGTYALEGSCTAIACKGEPPSLKNAEPREADVAMQNWTYDMKVHYDCKDGYHGRAEAMCGIDGQWLIVHNSCQENSCGPAPTDVSHAHPLLTADSVRVGTVVRYQCDKNFTGKPIATCGNEGLYVKEGRCLRFCGEPPLLVHASPSYDNDLAVANGWTEGMRSPYTCHPGYVGFVTAVCSSNGSYVIGGQCVSSSSPNAPSPCPECQNCPSCNPTSSSSSAGIQGEVGSNVLGIAFIIENAILLAAGILWFFRSRVASTQQRTSMNRPFRESELVQRPEALHMTTATT